jgi:Cdc6-like AAA superfamily ATPase
MDVITKNKTVTKIIDTLRANGLVFFAVIAILYMIYNVIVTAKESYCSSCSGKDSEECKKEHFSDYTGDKDNIGYISTNTTQCNQPIFKYGIPGASTKQRVSYL